MTATDPTRRWAVAKGHGTENDFVIVDDLDGDAGSVGDVTDVLSADMVRRLCDRRAGIGADGVLHVVPTAAVAEREPQAAGSTYFMDYRNADGSIAEMCGNGLRVFVRYLADAGRLDTDEPVIGTRAGALRTRIEDDGRITVDLGRPEFLPDRPMVRVEPMRAARAGAAVLMPNPHVVVDLDGDANLTALDLTRPPAVDHPLPHGQNVEFVTAVGDHHLRMRVHERGVGETRSCGTGIAAIVAVHGRPGDPQAWRIDVPGGTCHVRWDADGHLWLAGPAVIVGRIELDDDWLAVAARDDQPAATGPALPADSDLPVMH